MVKDCRGPRLRSKSEPRQSEVQKAATERRYPRGQNSDSMTIISRILSGRPVHSEIGCSIAVNKVATGSISSSNHHHTKVSSPGENIALCLWDFNSMNLEYC